MTKIIEILTHYTDVPAATIQSDSRLVADLGLTSLDVLDMVGEFEDEYDIEILDKDIKQMQTVQDIADYLSAHV